MPITLRSPTTSRKPPTFRRLVGAVLLLDAAEKQARDPGASIERRLAAIDEANRCHAQAWQALVSWTTDEGQSDLSARAAAKLGAAGRRLPLLAYALRIEAGLPVAFDKEAALCPASLARKPGARPARPTTSPRPPATRPRASP